MLSFPCSEVVRSVLVLECMLRLVVFLSCLVAVVILFFLNVPASAVGVVISVIAIATLKVGRLAVPVQVCR